MLSSKSSMIVSFIVGTKKKKMKLDFKIINGIEVNIDQTHNISNFGFDEHPESDYPFYNKNVKSKLLMKNEQDNILLKSYHKNYFKTVDIEQNPTELSYLSFHNKYLEFLESGTLQKDSTLLSICSDSILDLAVYPKIELGVHLLRLAESDDDYANYCVNFIADSIPYQSGDVKPHLMADCITPIDSVYFPQRFECINPGLDGSLDLFLENIPLSSSVTGYWYHRQDYDMTGDYDKIVYDPFDKSSLVIYASLDTMGRYRCNTKPVTLPSSWNTDRDNDGVLDSKITSTVPTNLNVVDIQNNLNTIYNKAGIHMTVTDKGYDTLNYNSTSFVANTPAETPYIHILKYGGNEQIMPKADTVTLWFIDELKTGNLHTETGDSAGRGTVDNSEKGRNSCVISSYYHLHSTEFKERTISHEIGHGVFSLWHPDDNGGKNDGLLNHVDCDQYNLMNSGNIYYYNPILPCLPNGTVKKIKEYRLRKYQWKYIRDGK
jgi:hypothetical protein